MIAKSKEFKIEKCVFAKCLRKQLSNLFSPKSFYRKNMSIRILKKCPPLYIAASTGSIEIVKLIYKLGEDYNQRIRLETGPFFVMPIFAAIENGHTEVAKL